MLINRIKYKVLIGFFLLNLISPILACTCKNNDLPLEIQITDRVKTAELVVVARAISIKKQLLPSQTSDPRGGEDEMQIVSFEIRKIFKGRLTAPLKVVSNLSNSCSFYFENKHKYLLFLNRNPKSQEFSTSICDLSKPINEASTDLKILNSIKK
jgi:hypothetical protein